MLRIRDARLRDAAALAAVHVASWKDGYRGMLPDDYLDALVPEDRLPAWRERLGTEERGRVILVAEDEAGGLLGFASLVAHPALGPAWAELPQIYLAPAAWGRGVGRTLMAALLERARGLGYEQVELWVVPDNTRARRFYEAGGWRSDGTERSEPVWGVTLPEVRYTRSTAE